MTKFNCGLFDMVGNWQHGEIIEGTYRTRDAASKYLGTNRDKIIDQRYLCVVTDNKNSIAVYLVTPKNIFNQKSLIEVKLAEGLRGDLVNVLVDSTLHAPKLSS